MKAIKFLFPILVAATSAMAQQHQQADSSKTLQEVVVQAYGQNRQLKELAAAVNVVGTAQLERYNNTSLLPALNATPGVRMEERSPGSYRLNVRGSTLRSPFGVRNIKIYWNDIPLTDPGGNTYLNQLSYFNIGSVEVIKGPAGSMYGAGMGGALLISGEPQNWEAGALAQYSGGSYGLSNLNVQIRAGKEDNHNIIGYSHQTSDGYRDHTALRRDVATWQTKFNISDRQQLSTSVMYGDLFYETPGALTAAEYLKNPQSARPAAGGFPSAAQAHAAVYQKTFLAGIRHQYRFSEQFRNTTVAYGAFSQFKNPTFRNYEKRTEPHAGARTMFTWQKSLGPSAVQVLFGGEVQKGFFNASTYGNRRGATDRLQTNDDIDNITYYGFAQASATLPQDWTFTAGVSINKSSVRITRLSVPGFVPVQKDYSNQWAPRVAISKKIFGNILLYGSISKGFSPPTSAELLPSTRVISTGLKAEQGTSYEAGFKGSWLQQRLYVEVNGFYFRLQDAIVLRRDSSNADYFVNAGDTKQYGIESQAYYQLFMNNRRFVTGGRIWVSHTYSHFRYHSFKQLSTDYSGKQLPSVAPQTFTAGLDISLRPGLYSNLTWFYSDAIALNDANSVFTTPYNLCDARIGWKKNFHHLRVDMFGGVDNLFDVRYSLGNDINAAGGRYYNAAPGINYFAGVTFQWLRK